MGVGGRKTLNNALVTGALFVLLPSSRASRKMPRLHRLAHEAPVTQPSVECACTARQKHDLALYATRRHNHSGCKDQNVRSSSVKNVYCWLFILGDEMFTTGKSRPILLMQILYNAVKRLILQMWWIELKYGFYLQNPAYFPRIYLWIFDKCSSISSFWQRKIQLASWSKISRIKKKIAS